MSLSGRVVLIAGGAGALGQAVTPVFSQAGARIVVMERRPPARLPDGQMAVSADVTDADQVQRAVADVMQKAGRLDVLVNLVGGFGPGKIEDTELSIWQKMFAINLTAAFLLSKAVIPHMRKKGSGRLLHIAARAALDPFPGAGAYLVAKSGLLALIRVLALELAGSGVTINGVLPTTIDTPANRKSMPDADSSKWVKPASIAQLLLFLASDASELNGALIPIGST